MKPENERLVWKKGYCIHMAWLLVYLVLLHASCGAPQPSLLVQYLLVQPIGAIIQSMYMKALS